MYHRTFVVGKRRRVTAHVTVIFQTSRLPLFYGNSMLRTDSCLLKILIVSAEVFSSLFLEISADDVKG